MYTYLSKNRLKHISLGILLVGCGIIIGWYSKKDVSLQKTNQLFEVRENSPLYTFINPLLLVGMSEESPKYADLKEQIGKYIDSTIKQDNAESVSIYFNELNSGVWTGINQNTLYDPASTMKVAVMLGYLKKASLDPEILSEKLAYVAKVDPGQHYPPETPLTSGTYTVRELIAEMIVNSDNVALEALYEHNRQAFVDVLKNLNIPPPATLNTEDFVSPRIYSRIFRSLYSSTYLPREFSEQALKLLSFTTFKNGLKVGIPETTVLAHKFGEHTTLSGDKVISRQLHDCGIIYYPTNPYFLCIMTKGADFKKLETIISDISKMVYTHMKSQ